MKEKIHPKFYTDAKVICGCGNTFTTGSVKKELRVDVCYKCHPFFTGQQRNTTARGRVEKFNKRFDSEEAKALRAEAEKVAEKKAAARAAEEAEAKKEAEKAAEEAKAAKAKKEAEKAAKKAKAAAKKAAAAKAAAEATAPEAPAAEAKAEEVKTEATKETK